MTRTLNLSLALATGLIGGAVSRYVTPVPAFAQTQTPKEIKAQSFVLVDDKDNIVETFKPSAQGMFINGKVVSGGVPTVVLLGAKGRKIWRAGVSAKTLSERRSLAVAGFHNKAILPFKGRAVRDSMEERRFYLNLGTIQYGTATLVHMFVP